MVSTWLRRIFVVIGFAAVGVAIAVLSHHQSTNTAQIEDLRTQNRALAVTAAENAQAARDLSEQIERRGLKPIVDVDDLPAPERGEQGDPGEPGPQGQPGRAPTAGEIRTAVTAYCADGRCDGQDPTSGQVAAAVASYCNDRGQCRGAAGTNGEDGKDGSDGRAGTPGRDGQDGAPPTQQQINAAVATYCNANGGCRGPQGPEGAAGEPGTPAVPFTFSFTVELNPVQSRTYTCTVTAPDQTVTCSSEDT